MDLVRKRVRFWIKKSGFTLALLAFLDVGGTEEDMRFD